jgi:hypothetical protein
MKQKAKRVVLGEGEIFGHKHILVSDKDIEFEKTAEALRFELQGTGILSHDEHAKMVFPQGSYTSYNQVELNPFDGTVQRVFD